MFCITECLNEKQIYYYIVISVMLSVMHLDMNVKYRIQVSLKKELV